jgi:hypothetical protein
MPRSIVRPTVGTYHAALYYLLPALRELPTTKSGDKFIKSVITYAAGLVDMPYGSTVQEIYGHLSNLYDLPSEFLTWIRVKEQYAAGKKIPAQYGTVDDCQHKLMLALYQANPELIPDTEPTEPDETDELTENYEYVPDEGLEVTAGETPSSYSEKIDNGLSGSEGFDESDMSLAAVRARSVNQWGEELTDMLFGFAEQIRNEVDSGLYDDDDEGDIDYDGSEFYPEDEGED